MKKLKKEFEDKFCYQKFPFDNGDLRFSCASTNNKVWQWIIEHYIPKESVPAETQVRQGAVQPVLRTEIEEKYNELIMAVAKKFTNETRHETALRYINEAESFQDNSCSKNESGNLHNVVGEKPQG
jgi:hypothetical protein